MKILKVCVPAVAAASEVAGIHCCAAAAGGDDADIGRLDSYLRIACFEGPFRRIVGSWVSGLVLFAVKNLDADSAADIADVAAASIGTVRVDPGKGNNFHY